MTERAALPDFGLSATGNTRFQLSAFHGHPFVLYSYPRDNTPRCTDEGAQFRDLHPEFLRAGVAVFGISHDPYRARVARRESARPREGSARLRAERFCRPGRIPAKP